MADSTASRQRNGLRERENFVRIVRSFDLHQSADVLSEVLRLPLSCIQCWVDVVRVYKHRRFRLPRQQQVREKNPQAAEGLGDNEVTMPLMISMPSLGNGPPFRAEP